MLKGNIVSEHLLPVPELRGMLFHKYL